MTILTRVYYVSINTKITTCELMQYEWENRHISNVMCSVLSSTNIACILLYILRLKIKIVLFRVPNRFFKSYLKVLIIETSTSLGSLQKFEGAAGELKGALSSWLQLISSPAYACQLPYAHSQQTCNNLFTYAAYSCSDRQVDILKTKQYCDKC